MANFLWCLSPTSPFFCLGGHGDILFSICEMACIGGIAHWAPLRCARPQTETLCALYFSHAETVLLREQISERDVLIAELSTETERAVRREEQSICDMRVAEQGRVVCGPAGD